MASQVRLIPGAMAKLLSRRGGSVDVAMRRLAVDAASTARSIAPKKTGRLSRSIRVTPARAPAWNLVADTPYAGFVTEGTRPHRIPRAGSKSMAFQWQKLGAFTVVPSGGVAPYRGLIRAKGGALIIAKGYVDHPGTKSNPFLHRAASQVVARTRGRYRRFR